MYVPCCRSEDLYSSAAIERYMLDRLQVPLDSAVTPRMTDANFAEGNPSEMAGLIVDAGALIWMMGGLEPDCVSWRTKCCNPSCHSAGVSGPFGPETAKYS